jgi:hypothetical protein
MATESKTLLKIYEQRKPTKDGKPPSFWIGLVPSVLPDSKLIDKAVAEMRATFPEVTSVNRPDDGKTDPKTIEDFHVTFCAALKDPHNYPELKKHIEESRFTSEDLKPKRDKDGNHIYKIFKKGQTAFVIFEYDESKRLLEERKSIAEMFCQMYDAKTGKGYQVHAAHVTVAYGNTATT